MTIYTVHAPPARDRRAGRDEVRAVFVKEGFCWPGLAVPLFWLIFRRMWIVLAFYIIAAAAMAALGREPLLSPLAMALGILVPLLLGFEGNDLRRWSLGLRGYEFEGVVEASSQEEAEIRYFATRDEPPVPAPSAPPAARPLPASTTPAIIGLFPASGGAS